MYKKIRNTSFFMILTIISFTGISNSSLISCDPWEVYHMCTTTAYNNYKNGDIGADLLVKFYNDYCKKSASSCISAE